MSRRPSGNELSTPPSRGAIFDIDGVVVDSPHENAWRESLRRLMEGEWSQIRGQTSWRPDAFTSSLYQQEISGKPRLAGARAALDHFGIHDDAAGSRRALYAGRKQEMVRRLIEAGDFRTYPDALRFIIAIKEAGFRIAAASSSKNAKLLLAEIRLESLARQEGIASPTIQPSLTLLEYFDVDVSGRDFEHGKPHPEMFLTAARELGVEPRRTVVLEDAAVGIEAAKAASMSAIGIARGEDANLLVEAGADLVVTSLDQVDMAALAEGRLLRH